MPDRAFLGQIRNADRAPARAFEAISYEPGRSGNITPIAIVAVSIRLHFRMDRRVWL